VEYLIGDNDEMLLRRILRFIVADQFDSISLTLHKRIDSCADSSIMAHIRIVCIVSPL